MNLAVVAKNLLLCSGNALTQLAALPAQTCQNIGQIQKFMVQFTYLSSATLNEIVVGTDDPALKATWDALKAAADKTTVVVSPTISNPENEAGEPRTYGGGNQTPGGVEKVLGTNASPFTCQVDSSDQGIIKKMKEWAGLEISLFLINEAGQIIGTSRDSTAATTHFKGIPIYGSTFFVGDKVLGGFEGVDYNPVSWQFNPGWSDDLAIVTPTDFNALTDL